MLMKKVLFICTGMPSTMGGLKSIYYDLIDFSKEFEVHFIRINTGLDKDIGVLELPKNIKISKISAKKSDKQAKFNINSFNIKSLYFPVYFKHINMISSVEKDVQNYINKNKIDIVIIKTSTCCLALRNLKAKLKVAELADSSARYYITKYEHFKTISSLLIKNISCVLDYLFETEIKGKFDMYSFISQLDKEKSVLDKNKIIIKLERRDRPLLEKNLGNRKYDVVIIGRWMHPPNRDGLYKIFDKLRNIKGNILIIGPGLQKFKKIPENVTIKGYVNDLSPIFSNTKVCLIPVWYGGGLQNKMFDGLRHGCIVVSTNYTKKTFESNGLKSDCIIYDDNIIEATNHVLNNYNPKNAQKSYDTYKLFYDICKRNEEEYIKKVKELINQKQ